MKYMRDKAWPHWDTWNEVFGKECAGGGKALDSAETVKMLPFVQRNEQETFTEFVGANYPMSFEELFPDEVIPEGMNHDVDSGSNTNVPNVPNVPNAPNVHNVPNVSDVPNVPNTPKAGSRKRKGIDPMDKLVDLMKQMHEDTNEHLKTLSTRIGYEFDLSTKRAEIFNQLGVVSGLTLKHKFFVGQKLVKEPELMDLFKGAS